MAAVKEAARLGAKCAVADFVKPSPYGSVWGLGGTCLNVGCIPKKLMHSAANYGEGTKESKAFGWEYKEAPTHNWTTMVDNIQDYIASANFGHRSECMTAGIKYFNELASFVDAHTVECTNRQGKKTRHTAKYFLVCVGGRPQYPDVPGAKEHAITSDDIFSLDHAPGKTLCIGASYIALECAGFLRGLGYDVTVMVRSILLRGFDQQMANMVGEHMTHHGVQFIFKETPKKLTKMDDGRIRVEWGEDKSDDFDTVLFATGRYPDLAGVNLDAANVKTHANGKILMTNEQTNVENIYALGDCAYDVPELTPSAIQAGRLLAGRLFGNSKVQMDYDNIATTVFTPMEYSVIGLSEEVAIERLGQENVEVYHQFWKPLIWTIDMERDGPLPYAKLVCNKKENNRIIGFHYLGHNAGEVAQGFGTAIKLGATYDDFIQTVGIHPTDAETVVGLKVTKSSGVSPKPPGC